MSQNLFTFAGTKDRRAVTAQRVSAFRLPASKIEQLMARKPFGDSLVASDCTYAPAPLRLGMLGGNHFTITLRDVDGSDAADGGGDAGCGDAGGGDAGGGDAGCGDAGGGDGAPSPLVPSNVQAALEGLRTHGFPNYFGLQRFGANVDAATHEVGAALLRADYPQALRLLDEGVCLGSV